MIPFNDLFKTDTELSVTARLEQEVRALHTSLREMRGE
jgi:hypothetical protein